MDPMGDVACIPERRRTRSTWVAAAIVVLPVAALVVYLPTPGDYWIRYDNETLIRGSERVQALSLSGAERIQALTEMFSSVAPTSSLRVRPLRVRSLVRTPTALRRSVRLSLVCVATM